MYYFVSRMHLEFYTTCESQVRQSMISLTWYERTSLFHVLSRKPKLKEALSAEAALRG
jgi:hypothetical protein